MSNELIEARIALYVEALSASGRNLPGEGFRLVANTAKNAKYRRIVTVRGGKDASVHAFVDAAGKLYKAAGWASPVKYGAAYDFADDASFAALLADFDIFGGHLYAGRQSYTVSS